SLTPTGRTVPLNSGPGFPQDDAGDVIAANNALNDMAAALAKQPASGGTFAPDGVVSATSHTFGGGDMQVASIVPNDQIATASGDLVSGGFAGPEQGRRDRPVVPGVLNRQPTVDLQRKP